MTGEHRKKVFSRRVRSRTDSSALVIRDSRRSFSTAHPVVGLNRPFLRRCGHAGRGAVASPPDRWGRPQTEASGRPDCGCGSRTSRGALLALGQDPLPVRAPANWMSSVSAPSPSGDVAGRSAPAASRRQSCSSFDAARCRSSPAGAGEPPGPVVGVDLRQAV